MNRVLLAGVVVAVLTLSGFAQHHEEQKTAQLNFVVIKDTNGKPVRNAEIVLHPVDKMGKQKQEGLELKTHEDGKASVAGIPYGKLRVQVIASGYRTYGEDYDIAQPAHEITIKMQRPADQYSIYK
ncbi:MAG TPA: carboxypeptidase-like regulatory domain-containing protein [Candidatus Angelobacter sp.]|nr:carboxypeptidase-like regulatory domain-containing protein [Candidatus Angelobacter sp.]